MSTGGYDSVLSVVVPAKNEAPNLPQLIDEIVRALRPLSISAEDGLAAFEVLIVDDASTDETPRVLRELSWRLSRVEVVKTGFYGRSVFCDRRRHSRCPRELDCDA